MRPIDVLNKYQTNDGNIGSNLLHLDDGSVCGSVTSSSVVSAAPSALRKGKYAPRTINSTFSQDMLSDLTSVGTKPTFDDENSTIASPKSPKNVTLNDNPSIHNIPQKQIEEEGALQKKYSELPSYCTLANGITILNSGSIYGRCSRFSVFFRKKLKEYIWIHCKPATILFFRSVQDASKWMNSKFLPFDEKKKLIKYSLDFDTMGVLKKKRSSSKLSPAPIENIRVMKYDMTDVHTKRSKLDGSIVHKFSIERWTSSGTSIEASFCSSDMMEVKFIRKSIRKCMKKVSKKHEKQYDCDSISVKSAALSDLTNFTGVSKTEYKLIEQNAKFSIRKTKKHRHKLI